MKHIDQFIAAIESTAGTLPVPDVAYEAFHNLSGFLDLLGQIDRRLNDTGATNAHQ